MILYYGLPLLFICGYTQCCSFVDTTRIHHHCGYTPLIFQIFFSVWPWCICTGIASEFISASFSDSMGSYMPCFPGINLSRLIDTSWRILDICSTLLWLSLKSLHAYCILIGLHHPSEKFFPPINIPNHSWKTPHVDLILQLTALSYPEIILSGQKLLIL